MGLLEIFSIIFIFGIVAIFVIGFIGFTLDLFRDRWHVWIPLLIGVLMFAFIDTYY